jgi:DNA-binding XRE family transcriptional regulator
MVSPIGATAEEASRRRAARSPEYRAEQERLAPYREIARQVILLRTRQGISQEPLAQRVGTSKSAIVRLESGFHHPNMETLRRVAEAFGTRLVVGFTEPSNTRVASA